MTETKSDNTQILTRLRRVEGQIRGIQRMIEEDRECEAIVTQLMAARAALDRAGMQIMSEHIGACLVSASSQSDRAHLDRVISFFFKFAGELPAPTAPTEGDTQDEL